MHLVDGDDPLKQLNANDLQGIIQVWSRRLAKEAPEAQAIQKVLPPILPNECLSPRSKFAAGQ